MLQPGMRMGNQGMQWHWPVAWNRTLLPTTVCTTVYEQRPGRRVQVSRDVVSLIPCSGTAQGHQHAGRRTEHDQVLWRGVQQPHPSSSGAEQQAQEGSNNYLSSR